MGRSRQSPIYQRADGQWAAALELPPVAGKRRRRVIYAPTEREVKRKLITERRALEERGNLATGSGTVAAWFEYWLKEIAPSSGIRQNTLVGYRAVVKNHIIPEIGAKKLIKITTDDIRLVVTRILSTPKSKSRPDGPKLSDTYAKYAFRVMSVALKAAEREDKLLGRNPCDLMPAPRKARPQLSVLDTIEAKEILKRAASALDADGPYDQEPFMWAFYLLTAMRRCEAIGLEWNRAAGHLEVTWQLQRIPDPSNAPPGHKYRHLTGSFYLTEVKTLAGNRVIPLVEPLRTMLALHSKRAGDNPHGLVFAMPDGTPFDPDGVTYRWRRWLEASGITASKVRLHDLRHTTVDMLYEAGVPEDIIIDIVGHSTLMQSRAYKVRLQDPRLTSAMEALSGLLA